MAEDGCGESIYSLDVQGCPDTFSESSEAGWKKAPVGSRVKTKEC